MVIVGAGAAGCALAARLSEDRDCQVLLLEAGDRDRSPLISAPVGLLSLLAGDRYNWRYPVPDRTRDHRQETWPAGRVLGGGTSINGMLYVRGDLRDYDAWQQSGATGWSGADVLPYLKRLECYEGGAPEWRGRDGPVPIEQVQNLHPLAQAFIAAAQEYDLPLNADYNGNDQFGVAPAQIVQRHGRRWSASRAYLQPSRGRRNITVRTGALAARLQIEKGRCVGVEYRQHGKRQAALARERVVLSAGAIATPKLLMLSGIGPESVLKNVGIKPILHQPAIGANLADHVSAGISVHTRRSSFNTDVGAWSLPRHLLRYAAGWPGALSTTMTQAVAFLRTGDGPRSDVELMFSPMSIELRGRRYRPYGRPAVNLLASVSHVASRGRTYLRSVDIDEPPVIEAALLEADADRATLIRGLRAARSLLYETSFRTEIIDERYPGSATISDNDWARYLRARAMPVFHPIGTCRMGDAAEHPVDPNLRLKGLDGLSIADTSIIPTHISGHTHAAAMMIGERAADIICGQMGGSNADH